MKEKDNSNIACHSSTSDSGTNKSLIDDDEAEIVSAIQAASRSKARKFSGNCLKNHQLSLASRSSLFNRLPPEVLEVIFGFLSNEDVKALASANDRCQAVAQQSPTLKLHFLSRCDLLAKISKNPEIHKIVLKDPNLKRYLDTNMTFVRLLPELQSGCQRVVAKTVFFFGRPNFESKLAYLLEISGQRYPYHQRHLFVVVAVDRPEGEQLVQGLHSRGVEAAYFSSFNSNAAFRQLQSTPERFFFVVSYLTPNFRQTGMRAIINFQELQDRHEYLALHTLDPRTVHTYVNITDVEQLRQARELIQYLQVCGKKPLDYSNPVMLFKSHYL
jgi:hypothetical protein